jgi:hypothetical protein
MPQSSQKLKSGQKHIKGKDGTVITKAEKGTKSYQKLKHHN